MKKPIVSQDPPLGGANSPKPETYRSKTFSDRV